MKKILFVCFGNLCRSPSAELFFRHKIHANGLEEKIMASSAGISANHSGQNADYRAIEEANKRGILQMPINPARQITPEDYYENDIILAMENEQLISIEADKPEDCSCEIDLLLNYVDYHLETEIKDPYYGIESNFDHLFNTLDEALDLLIDKVTD